MSIIVSSADIYATKGIEYLLVIGFLLLLVVFWKIFTGGRSPARILQGVEAAGKRAKGMAGWFRVPQGYLFHQGHTWARSENGDGRILLVGIDGFASKLAGRIDAIRTAEVGQTVRAGEPALTLKIDSRSVDMLAPVEGKVLAVNEKALGAPAAVVRDPYGEGWILKIETPDSPGALRSLLSGELASVWMEHEARRLASKIGAEAAGAWQDGGEPVDGVAMTLDPERWDRLMGEFFLTGYEQGN